REVHRQVRDLAERGGIRMRAEEKVEQRRARVLGRANEHDAQARSLSQWSASSAICRASPRSESAGAPSATCRLRTRGLLENQMAANAREQDLCHTKDRFRQASRTEECAS